MKFSFDSDDCYRIEHSETHRSLGTGVKICECVVRRGRKILFIEAKSSFSNPVNKEDFQKDMQDMLEKFQNSIMVYAGLLAGRPYHKGDDLPENLKRGCITGIPICCYLIIYRHEKNWLPPVDDALNQGLSVIMKTFAIDFVKAVTKETALKFGLIQGFSV